MRKKALDSHTVAGITMALSSTGISNRSFFYTQPGCAIMPSNDSPAPSGTSRAGLSLLSAEPEIPFHDVTKWNIRIQHNKNVVYY